LFSPTTRLATLVFAAVALSSALTVRGSSTEHRAHLSSDLTAHEARHTTARARVIVNGTDAELDALASRHHVQILRRLNGAAVVAANSAELTELAADAAVDHLSGDLPVRTWMSVSNKSTEADKVKGGSSSLLGLSSLSAVDGTGIGVAVIDSGIASHAALAKRVVANVSFVTGDPTVTDTFGHGTHVAGIIAGGGSAAALVTPLYTGGIAPGVQLVNVRVLGADGTGLTSDVIAGIDWAITRRKAYNIQVINLSLGHPVVEPAATDPLCIEVAKAVNAGITVVVSAGNAGKTADGTPMLGGITSPGNSPYAITVGALNTKGTVDRSDDVVATYSSRGPTRFDFAMKPDIAAPGNKIISLEAKGSYLPTMYPFLHTAGTGTNAYMQLSGTSMATPMVSGAVALLLQGSPSLSPAQIKIALQTGATFMPNEGFAAAGTGSVDFLRSRQIAANGLSVVPSLLTDLTGPSGATFWDAGTLADRLFKEKGLRLLSVLDLVNVWLNPSLLKFGDLNLVGSKNPLKDLEPNRLLWGYLADWCNGYEVFWGTPITGPQGQQIIWSDGGTTYDNQIIWSDSVLTSSNPR
jgi:serine protease AprX